MKNNLDKQYFELCSNILKNGHKKLDRTGTGTVSLFGSSIYHNMNEGFPILTSKKVQYESMIVELLWFLKGRTDLNYLIENNCNVWIGDAFKKFGKLNQSKKEFIQSIKDTEIDLGKIYGYQWRNFLGSIDQVSDVIQKLKTNPDDRRMLVTAWNPSEISYELAVLPPCHYGWQLYTRPMDIMERVKEYCGILEKDISYGKDLSWEFLDSVNFSQRKISLLWNQRSVDVPLGLPFNISSYGLLLILLGKEVNMIPERLVGNLGDTHIYLNQIEGVKKQMNNKTFELPKLSINRNCSIFEYNKEDFSIDKYLNSGLIKYELSN